MYRARYLQPTDRRLGRHVNHDPRSRRFPVREMAGTVASVRHERHVPIFDQGNLGSCTGNAAIGCMSTGSFFATVDANEEAQYPLTEGGAVLVYGAATAVDSYAGTYPPEDTGSDGLSVAKVLKSAGWISGYEHAFSFDQGLAALMAHPLIVGVNWYDDMFSPDPSGRVRPTGGLAGGHEFVWDSYDAIAKVCGFTNSWAGSWGLNGRFTMTVADFTKLLAQDGDVTSFVPITTAPPQPQPTSDPGDVMWAATKAWSKTSHVGSNAAAARAVARWATRTNRS
jgi:hypothetical protein